MGIAASVSAFSVTPAHDDRPVIATRCHKLGRYHLPGQNSRCHDSASTCLATAHTFDCGTTTRPRKSARLHTSQRSVFPVARR